MDHEDLLETLPEEVHLETPTRLRAPSEPGGRNRAALDPLPLMGGARVQSEPCTYTCRAVEADGAKHWQARVQLLHIRLYLMCCADGGVPEIAMESYGPPRMIEEGERPGACPGNFSISHASGINASAHCVCGSGTLLCRSCAVAALQAHENWAVVQRCPTQSCRCLSEDHP